ncbi:hypothetical protein GCM10011403_29410 [Pseudohongiella nitratireducens]|uniref:Uncharacterized protein n=1 Tax=Pseudohongiella nitratireducens TaxID=1768907 RepID=A0A916QM58_9GAMM|nr:hypothetical protein [Pseudohongiella nitratireducens]GFZ83938.1 hypothetical protein GCM10011403_29410 [Pseudohongiella nitratireducens]
MSQQTIGAPTGVGTTIADIFETLSNTWLSVETLKRGMPLGYTSGNNDPASFPHVNTGTNYDGTTIVSGQLISGVQNKHLAAGVGLLVAAGIIVYAYS